MEYGTIIKGVGGLYSVYYQGDVYTCKPRGKFRKDQIKPMIGDNVVLGDFAETADGYTAVIDEILERKNSLIRPAVANVDRIVFVIAAVAPMPDLLLLDKMLAAAKKKNISAVIVVNKADQDDKVSESLADVYKNAATKVILTCAVEGSGVETLENVVSQGISVMAGQSGVGKSSLVNCLLKNDKMATGGLTKKLDRGRHTTRHSEMFSVGDGLVIDSPGFSLFELTDVLPTELQLYYPELSGRVAGCRFMDCSHTGEPGCCVTELLEKGSFDSGRYERYKIIYKDLKEKEKNKYK